MHLQYVAIRGSDIVTLCRIPLGFNELNLRRKGGGGALKTFAKASQRSESSYNAPALNAG